MSGGHDSLKQFHDERHAAWLFALAFVAACGLFWWLPSLITRYALNSFDPVTNPVLAISLIAVATFLAGFLFLGPRKPAPTAPKGWELDGCAEWGYALALALALPALLMAVHFSAQRMHVEYGSGEGIPFLHQAVLYAHMFFCLLFLGASRDEPTNRGRLLLVIVLLLLPRLLISLTWGRFFVAQAIVPVVLLAVSRGWLRLNPALLLKLAMVAAMIIFVPAMTRGDRIFGEQEIFEFFAYGSTLKLFQDNLFFDLSGRCEPLLVSLTAKLIPWGALHECVIDLGDRQQVPATLDRLLTSAEIGSLDALVGTGSNYLLELFLFGGIGAILLGSLLLGWSSRWFIRWLSVPSIFAGIWAECLTRTLFAPRSNFGYIFERIPGLLLAILAVAALAYLTHRRAPPFWHWKSA
jgi:hypothetical protein